MKLGGGSVRSIPHGIQMMDAPCQACFFASGSACSLLGVESGRTVQCSLAAIEAQVAVGSASLPAWLGDGAKVLEEKTQVHGHQKAWAHLGGGGGQPGQYTTPLGRARVTLQVRSGR